MQKKIFEVGSGSGARSVISRNGSTTLLCIQLVQTQTQNLPTINSFYMLITQINQSTARFIKPYRNPVYKCNGSQ